MTLTGNELRAVAAAIMPAGAKVDGTMQWIVSQKDAQRVLDAIDIDGLRELWAITQLEPEAEEGLVVFGGPVGRGKATDFYTEAVRASTKRDAPAPPKARLTSARVDELAALAPADERTLRDAITNGSPRNYYWIATAANILFPYPFPNPSPDDET